jgi:hypothetical protein
MCDAETYKSAAKQYTEKVFVAGSPMHTVAMLFTGSLQAPPISASNKQSDHWGVDPDALKSSWKQHLAAIISNRTVGWDRIVLSLGDRLNELHSVHAAHFCYMVCGCPITSPTSIGSRIALLGCDHNESLNMALMTDEALAAYDRTEAYEWAKRKGNKNAAIQSFQAFKVIYAMLLADSGLEANAKLLAKSIRQCSDIPAAKSKKSTRSTLSQLFDDRETLAYALSELEFRLGARTDPRHSYEEDNGDNGENAPPDERAHVERVPIAAGKTDLRKSVDKDTKSAGLKNPGNGMGRTKVVREDATAGTQKLAKQRTLGSKKRVPKQTEQKAEQKQLQTSSPLNQKAVRSKSSEGESKPPAYQSQPDGGVDASFLSAKSNLMDITGYSHNTPEKPSKPTTSVTEKTNIELQESTPRQGPPMINTSATTPRAEQTPQPVSAKQPPLAMTTPQPTTKAIEKPPNTAPPVMMGKTQDRPSQKKAPASSDSKLLSRKFLFTLHIRSTL